MGEIFTHAAAQLSLTYLSEPGKQTGAGCNAHYRAAVMIPIASSTPALETRMLIADIMEAAGMIIVSCVGITTHCMRDG